MSIKIVGGYGSAGAGNKTGRKSARFGGANRKARSRVSASGDRDAGIESKSTPSRLDEPTRDELLKAIAEGYCWWCGHTHTKEGKEIRLWSQHWRIAHGVDNQDLRNRLGLSKKEKFCTPDLSQGRRLRAIASGLSNLGSQYLVRGGAGIRRVFSVYGRKVQAEKLARYKATLTPQQRSESARRGGLGRARSLTPEQRSAIARSAAEAKSRKP